MSGDTQTVISSKSRDERFYLSSVTIEVEGILFRIPRQPLETESEIFKEMFQLPIPTGAPVEGNTDEKPLVLHGITAKAFRAFCRVLFHRGDVFQIGLTQDEWISVLHLAQMWGCNRILDIAITKLDTLITKPVEKVTLAKKYKVKDWLRPALMNLTMRPKPLSLEEANELGMDYVVKLNDMRERRYQWVIDNTDTDWMQPQYAREKIHWNPVHSWVQEVRRVQVKNDQRLRDTLNAALTRTFDLD